MASPSETSYKIAMIGDASTVAGFAAGGVQGFPQDPDDPAQTLSVLTELARSGEYAIIFITEQLAEPLFEGAAEILRIEQQRRGAEAIVTPDLELLMPG